MLYQTSSEAIGIFLFFVAVVLGLSLYLGRKARSSKGYYAAHGQIHWFVNGIAFAGDYLSAASFLGICGMIAFYGYDGFLYSIGFLAGWVVALFVIAEPIKRLGKFTFADALDSAFDSPGIKFTAAISTLVVSIFYLIPQMVGAGSLITPLLGLPYWAGVVIVGVTVTVIVVTAGMVSTTWVQFIKGSLLVVVCFVLVTLILNRGLSVTPAPSVEAGSLEGGQVIAPEGEWKTKPYVRVRFPGGQIITYRAVAKESAGFLAKLSNDAAQWTLEERNQLTLAQTRSVKGGEARVDGLPQTMGDASKDIKPNDLRRLAPSVNCLAAQGNRTAGAAAIPLDPARFHDSDLADRSDHQRRRHENHRFLSSAEKGRRSANSGCFADVCGRSLDRRPEKARLPVPHARAVLRHCRAAAHPNSLLHGQRSGQRRKSTIVGIGAIGFFYLLTLILGLGAMTSGAMDPTNTNMAAPLLAKSFSNTLFAIISALAFTTVLGTVSGLIMAGSGAVAHDLLKNLFRVKMDDHKQVIYGKFAAAGLGVLAMALGIVFQNFNVAFLVGWAFNIAASANLPALVMLLFWKRTTAKGIAAGVTVGLVSSLAWILLSPQCYKDVYHIKAVSFIPFSQPALVTVPLSFIVLIVVSLMTTRTAARPTAA